ncbi:MAG: tol-pal system protein YbgF [Rickettsiales endosymbiont of Dermacentor nuttalli]
MAFLLTTYVMAYNYEDQYENILMDRIDRLERGLTALQKQFYSKSNSKTVGQDINYNNAASIENRIDIVEERIRELVGQIEQLDHNIDILAKKLGHNVVNNANLEQKASPETKREITDGSQNNSLGTISVKVIENIQSSKNSFDDSMEDDFKKAFTLLKTARKGEAIMYFKQFIKNHPHTDLTPEAYYWLGEIYFFNKDFENASINFLHNYKLAPKGEKVMDSMLKLSISLQHLQKTKDACLILSKLIKDFPSKPIDIKNKTLQLNKELNCK